jgi:polar amino acid transport system permease protein
MISLSLLDILLYLLSAARWTLYLSAMAFVGGGLGASLLLAVRFGYPVLGARFVSLFTELFQGTPLLLQLFIVFFGLPVLGFDVPPAVAAGVALSLYASAYLADIWRGCVEAIPRGQWDAAAGLGMSLVAQMRDVILPQAASIAIPPTVGFLVQLIKATALASIVGYDELMRAGQIITNAIFQPFLVYGLVALVYFAMCFPLTLGARFLERRFSRGRVRLAEGKT